MSVNTSMVNFHISLFYKMIETLPKSQKYLLLKSTVENDKVTSIIAIIQKFLKLQPE